MILKLYMMKGNDDDEVDKGGNDEENEDDKEAEMHPCKYATRLGQLQKSFW